MTSGLLSQAGDRSGKAVVTCSLQMNADDTELVVAHTPSGAEALARKVRSPHAPSPAVYRETSAAVKPRSRDLVISLASALPKERP